MDTRGSLLLVDDDDGVRTGLAFALEDCGWTVTAVADPLAAILAMVERVPDVAVVDLMLPGFLGDALLQLLRGHVPHLPAVIITGSRGTVMPTGLSSLGWVPVIEKPFDTGELDRTCRDLWECGTKVPGPLPSPEHPLADSMADLIRLADDPRDAHRLSRCVASLLCLHRPCPGRMATTFERLAEACSLVLAALTTGDAERVDAERVITGISTLGALLSRAPGQPGQGIPDPDADAHPITAGVDRLAPLRSPGWGQAGSAIRW